MTLPADEGAHVSQVEWWYFNGRLTTESGDQHSFHFVTFQSVLPNGLTPRLAQASWVDHSKRLHITGERAELPLLEPTTGEFDLPTLDWRMTGNGREYSLVFQVDGYGAELTAFSPNPAVLHHGTGLVDLGIAGKTYYYSRTGLGTTGTVSIDGETQDVSGTTWMDHQWGDFSTREIGWDWLSLELDDGSALTVSFVWEQEGRRHITSYATYVPATGEAVHIPDGELALESSGEWTSPDTGAVYPMGWRLTIDSLGLDVTLVPVVENAEFANSTFIPVAYWEGPIDAKGTKAGETVNGEGFVEMVGYDNAGVSQP